MILGKISLGADCLRRHPARKGLRREHLETLDRIRRTLGEYYFAGQSPAPLGGGRPRPSSWWKFDRG